MIQLPSGKQAMSIVFGLGLVSLIVYGIFHLYKRCVQCECPHCETSQAIQMQEIMADDGTSQWVPVRVDIEGDRSLPAFVPIVVSIAILSVVAIIMQFIKDQSGPIERRVRAMA